jgi:hypothetical protein
MGFGHIKLSRKVFDAAAGDELWKEKRKFSRWEAWVDLIQMAAWKQHTRLVRGERVVVPRGHFFASIRFLADRWQWSKDRARGFLIELATGLHNPRETPNATRIETVNETLNGTLYRIVNYDTYQQTQDTKPDAKRDSKRDSKRDKVEASSKKQLTTPASGEADSVPSESPVLITPVVIENDTAVRLWKAWEATGRSINCGRFRNALKPLFPATGQRYPEQQLLQAIEAFNELAEYDGPKNAKFWTVNKFVENIGTYVDWGAMAATDQWGVPTERGQMAIKWALAS